MAEAAPAAIVEARAIILFYQDELANLEWIAECDARGDRATGDRLGRDMDRWEDHPDHAKDRFRNRARQALAAQEEQAVAWEEAWKGARCNELRLEEALRRIINRADPERLSPIQYEAARAAAKIAQEAIDARGKVDVPASDRETAYSEPVTVDFPSGAFPAPVQLPAAGENGNYGYAHDPHDQVRDDAARSVPVQPAGDVEKVEARLRAYLNGDSRYKAWRGKAPEGEPTLNRDLTALLASRHLPARGDVIALIDDYADHHDGCDQATPDCSCGFRQRYREALTDG